MPFSKMEKNWREALVPLCKAAYLFASVPLLLGNPRLVLLELYKVSSAGK